MPILQPARSSLSSPQSADRDECASDPFDVQRLVSGFTAPRVPRAKADNATLKAADCAARRWTSNLAGSLVPGTEAHKHAVCCMFRDTFNPYRPSVIDWPRLDPTTLQRLVTLPIWDIAVQTEGKARLRMAAYANTVEDREMRVAIGLNAWEESRHKEVLSRMVSAYGIKLAKEAPYDYPRDPEWAYLVTGYSECIDSFFAFGLIEVARCSRLFPSELIETFEPVIQDECRHILLFANWVAWHRRQLSWWRRLGFELKVAAVWVFLVYERIGLACTIDSDCREQCQDNNFTLTGAKSVSAADLDAAELIRLCLLENARRFAGYDTRLLRPQTVPALARFTLRFMRRDDAVRPVE